MKTRFMAVLAALAIGLAVTVPDADAKRLGGGKSVGQQSNSVNRAPAQQNPGAQPGGQQSAQQAVPGRAAAATPPAGNRWLGPIAGIAAGLGLAALASHLGLGAEMGTFLLMALVAAGLFIAFRVFMARRQGAGGRPLAYQNGAASAGRPAGDLRTSLKPGAGSAAAGAAGGAIAATAAAGSNLPFDTDAFVRSARSQFVRLQAAFDKREIEDLREFTSPHMFDELSRDLAERGEATQSTDVVSLNAEFAGTDRFGANNQFEIASVRFSGLLRESPQPEPQAFEEIWNFTRPADRSSGWVLAGIQQVEAATGTPAA